MAQCYCTNMSMKVIYHLTVKSYGEISSMGGLRNWSHGQRGISYSMRNFFNGWSKQSVTWCKRPSVIVSRNLDRGF